MNAVVAGAEAVARLHSAELPQKDNLCGCFWGSIALRARGIESHDGEPIDQDRVALEAGTTLPDGGPHECVPPGEASRRDYRIELPPAVGPEEGGTSSVSLAAAIERLADGRLEVIPVAGPWTAASVVAVVRAAAEVSPEALLVANIRTGRLWSARPSPAALLAYLAGGDAGGGQPDWDTGHFVNLAGAVCAEARALVLVRDSYRSLGWAAHHLQPADAFAAALERGDGHEGGVLCVAPAADAAALRERLGAGGLLLRHWRNGTPARAVLDRRYGGPDVAQIRHDGPFKRFVVSCSSVRAT
jgi:hypothetical protein